MSSRLSRSPRTSRLSLLLVFLLGIEAPAYAAGAAAADPNKAEAAQRFDRGLQLFDEGDNAGALAEFSRTYELLPNPVVLYNMGLVYAAMGRPVDAVDALEKVLLTPQSLSPAQKERADRTLADQKARVGRLTVTTTPDGARVEVDNVEVAKTPLTAPIRVSEGSHVVGAVVEGYAPARQEVVIAGNADASVHLDLVSTQGKQLANLTVVSRVSGADVRVDDQPGGKTPLATSLTLVAGHHTVELRRPGYVSVKKEVDLGDGATGEMSFDLQVDPAALGSEGTTLALDSSEAGPDVFVDELPVGVYTSSLRLPRGPHHLRAEHVGFLPFERDITLVPGQSNIIKVDFEPTPETRAAYVSSAHAHRLWGWVSIIGGAVIAGGGGAFLAINSSSKSSAQKDLNSALAVEAAGNAKSPNPQHPCALFVPAADGTTDTADACNAYVDGYSSKLDSVKNRDIIGYVGLGVGAAAIVTGVVLLVTGGDPNKYDKAPSPTADNEKGPRFSLLPGPGQGGLSLGGVF